MRCARSVCDVIQIYTEGGALICGITRGNIERLTSGKPMRITPHRPVADVFIVFGEDKPSILRELRLTRSEEHAPAARVIAANPGTWLGSAV